MAPFVLLLCLLRDCSINTSYIDNPEHVYKTKAIPLLTNTKLYYITFHCQMASFQNPHAKVQVQVLDHPLSRPTCVKKKNNQAGTPDTMIERMKRNKEKIKIQQNF